MALVPFRPWPCRPRVQHTVVPHDQACATCSSASSGLRTSLRGLPPPGCTTQSPGSHDDVGRSSNPTPRRVHHVIDKAPDYDAIGAWWLEQLQKKRQEELRHRRRRRPPHMDTSIAGDGVCWKCSLRWFHSRTFLRAQGWNYTTTRLNSMAIAKMREGQYASCSQGAHFGRNCTRRRQTHLATTISTRVH